MTKNQNSTTILLWEDGGVECKTSFHHSSSTHQMMYCDLHKKKKSCLCRKLENLEEYEVKIVKIFTVLLRYAFIVGVFSISLCCAMLSCSVMSDSLLPHGL